MEPLSTGGQREETPGTSISITVEQDGNRFTFRDLYVDVMVPMDGRHHRMLDLDEFADAIDDGSMRIEVATDGLRRWQRFLDRYLHTERSPAATWTNFPPDEIRALLDLEPFAAPVRWNQSG